jgi:signal transduction histidine kinase/ligand-binding sensor domain-containing protein
MGARAKICACILASWATCAAALDPSLDVSQYAHTAWRIREGFAPGAIQAIAQTRDGYLWLGTEAGLMRFDGVKAVPWQPKPGEALPNERVRMLLSSRDATLWIGTSAGLASLKDGHLTTYPALAGSVVNGLVEDHEGAIWVGAQALPDGVVICAIRRGAAECERRDAGDGGSFLFIDTKDRLWAAGRGGVWRWRPGAPKHVPMPQPPTSVQAIAEDAGGALLVATMGGVLRVVDERAEPYAASGTRTRVLLRDREGALWVADDHGLLHLHSGRTDRFAAAGGLTADRVDRLLEDREGNIWVVTSEGLDRFREFAITTISTGQGLPTADAASVAATGDASVWISTTGGFARWRDGKLAADPGARLASLFQDRRGRLWIGGPNGVGYLENDRFVPVPDLAGGYVDSIAGDELGNVWFAHDDAGLVRWSPDGHVERIPWRTFGGDRLRARLAVDPSRGGLWVGFATGGIAYYDGERIRESFTAADGLGGGRVRDLMFDRIGALWIPTDGGLSRLKEGRIATLSATNGLPCNLVDWMIDDEAGAYWLNTACGLVRIARSELDAWAAAVDKETKARPEIHATVLDTSDGAMLVASGGIPSPRVTRSADGRIWFVARSGVSVFDPRHIRRNELPPPVQIEQLVIDHKPYDGERAANGSMRLPPLVHELQIDYTALSFVAPEKVRFRYRLEGYDRAWQHVGTRRQAFFSGLPPGDYRFQVIASNNSGVWNEQGAALDFSIAPAWWQTLWFRAACVVALVLLLVGLYQLRLRQVRREFNITLDARVSERMRIARDLHDTLLQSFHGVLLRFQTVSSLLPGRPVEAKQVLDLAIDQAAEAVTEGRDAVQELRTSATEQNDLANSIRALGESLQAESGLEGAVAFRVQVQGTMRALHPIVRDEVFRITAEAVRNAFRHSEAGRIEVELRYDDRGVPVAVRDDGRGMDSATLEAGGREGHFGLGGMRERAKLIGGRLTVWSAQGAGTEIELAIPASQAYSAAPQVGDE